MSTLLGNSDNNLLSGTIGDDILSGEGGSDTLLGGEGNDLAWYFGNQADFLIGNENAYLTIQDRNAANGNEGTDRLGGIEQLGFANGGLTVTGSEFRVNTTIVRNENNSAVTVLADGGFLVTWDSTSFGIYAQRYDALGGVTGSEFQVDAYPEIRNSAVTVLADGGFLITWNSFGQDGDNYGIYAQRYDAQNNPVGNEFQVNTYAASTQRYPTATALADGGFLITWSSIGQDGDGFGIYAQRYDAQGDPAGDEFQVNSYATSNQYDTAVTALADGGFLVTWFSEGQDGSGNGIYAQRYDALGDLAGSEFQVNTYTTASQDDPAVTALADGGFLITWTSGGQDGYGLGIYAQRYDADGRAVGLKITGTFSADVINLGTLNLLTVDGAGGNDLITGGASEDNLFGGEGNDTLTGNDGDDRLNGGNGNDILTSGSGDDRLDGGNGSDTLTGGEGSDLYVLNTAGDLIQETGSSGFDTVEAQFSYTLGTTLEKLRLTGSADISGTGNANSNVLIGNSGHNVLNGNAGGDLMIGGLGNDVYVVDSQFDVVAEDANSGSDKVQSSTFTFVLGNNLEDLELTGTAINGVGNALANLLLGNASNNQMSGLAGDDNLIGGAGNDYLNGGDGDDWLTGGAGADTLQGGDGLDIFRFDAALLATNVDVILDFVSGEDVIQLDHSPTLFTNVSAGGIPGPLYYMDFLAATSISANAAEHILYNTTTGGLYYNHDGMGSGLAVLIATLNGAPTLFVSDFEIV